MTDSASVRVIDPAVDHRWDAYVSGAAGASVFHHSSWKRVIEETFRLKPLYLAIEDGAGAIRCGVPFFLKKGLFTGKALESLPFSDYCDPLTEDGDEFRSLWDSALDEAAAAGARRIEVRRRDNGGIDLARYGCVKTDTYLNHYLEIGDDIDYIERKVIEKSYKYDIRQAVRSGVEVRPSGTEREMRQYYGLYVLTRSRHGLPPIPYAFFRNVWEVLAPLKMVYLFLAYWEERPIGGIILLRHDDCLYALSNSSDGRFLEKKPNHLLWWKAIQLAVDLGLSGLDFGRTALDNKGLRFFKRRWGTREIEINHYRYDLSGTNGNGRHGPSRLQEAMRGRLKSCPPWMLRFIGNVAYRYLVSVAAAVGLGGSFGPA